MASRRKPAERSSGSPPTGGLFAFGFTARKSVRSFSAESSEVKTSCARLHNCFQCINFQFQEAIGVLPAPSSVDENESESTPAENSEEDDTIASANLGGEAELVTL